jgi:hypothetical protein
MLEGRHTTLPAWPVRLGHCFRVYLTPRLPIEPGKLSFKFQPNNRAAESIRASHPSPVFLAGTSFAGFSHFTNLFHFPQRRVSCRCDSFASRAYIKMVRLPSFLDRFASPNPLTSYESRVRISLA